MKVKPDKITKFKFPSARHSKEIAVTYGQLVVNNYVRFGYQATPIVFGDFPAIVGSLFFLGVVQTQQEQGAAQKLPSNKSARKASRSRGYVKARPAVVNRGTKMPSKDVAAKEIKPYPTQVQDYSVRIISSKVVAVVPLQRMQYKNHKNKKTSAATPRSGKSVMVESLQVRLDKG
ncbi:hypothetical protein Taro_047388 [Colocasia esculenta]|uniref:Uncharacterized protein n=1 Tax=Colocasia esculenta TaxID=4460 RepID=A0A843X0R9_COLES|nr:hypothetical protein [Colocasia esculenta]